MIWWRFERFSGLIYLEKFERFLMHLTKFLMKFKNDARSNYFWFTWLSFWRSLKMNSIDYQNWTKNDPKINRTVLSLWETGEDRFSCKRKNFGPLLFKCWWTKPGDMNLGLIMTGQSDLTELDPAHFWCSRRTKLKSCSEILEVLGENNKMRPLSIFLYKLKKIYLKLKLRQGLHNRICFCCFTVPWLVILLK